MCQLYFSEINILISLLDFKQQLSDRTPEDLGGCPRLCESEKTGRKQVGNVQADQKSNLGSIQADQGEPIYFRYLWQELTLFYL